MKKKNSIGKRTGSILRNVFLWLCALTAIFPFLWMIGASLKKEPDVFEVPFKIFPDYLYLDNFKEVWFGSYDYPRMFLNSVFVVVLGVSVSIILCCVAGYGFGRLKFPGRDSPKFRHPG